MNAPVTVMHNVVRFAAFEVNLDTGELRKHGVHVKLQGQPFQILAMLLERPGQLVTREEIKQRLWPEDTFVDFDHSMNTAIRRLREALSDSADTPRYVETVPRKGYRFIGEVNGQAVIPERPEQLELVLRAVEHVREAETRRTRSWAAVSAGLLALLLLIGGVIALWMQERIDSVAMLPLANETNEAGLDFLSEGLSRGVIDKLSMVEGLRVASFASATKFAKNGVDVSRAAKELNARAIVLGSVRRNAERTHVKLELVDTRDNRHLWGKEYDIQNAAVASLENDMVRDLMKGMHLSVPAAMAPVLAKSNTNQVAYESYLRGNAIMSRRDNANFRSALMYFQRAIDADPNFALGYVGLGKAYGLLGAYGGMPMTEAGPMGEANFNRALEIDSNLAEAHAFKGVSLMTIHRNLAAAEKELNRALELNSNNAETYHAVEELLVRQGRLNDALAVADKAAQLDPDWSGYLSLKLWVLYYLGRNEEALALASARADFRANHLQMAELNLNAGRKEEALKELALMDLAKMQMPEAICMYAREYARLGDERRARGALARGLELQARYGGNSSRVCTRYSLARTYAVLSEKEKMYAALEASAAALEPQFGYAAREPLFSAYRGETRFQELVKLATTPR